MKNRIAHHAKFWKRAAIVAVLISALPIVQAEIIEVRPEEGQLSEAISRAASGDVVRLLPGRYEASVRVPGGVTIEGTSADEVTIVAQRYAALAVDGTDVIIRDLSIECAAGAHRGVASDVPVRVERCRFTGVPEAVALMTAPLSDVICCEFKDCGIAVRAIAEASPTVWGCRFEGGRIGVFALNGSPYVVINVFSKVETGIMLVSDDPHTRVFRHNIFMDCATAGIEIKGEDAFACASIRNSIFVRCSDPFVGPEALFIGVSHCAFEECGELSFNVDERHSVTGAFDAALNEDGSIRIEPVVPLAGKGVRWGHEPKGTTHDIGLTGGLTTPGVKPNEGVSLPPVRFQVRPMIANATSEEYQFMRMNGMRMTMQSLVNRDGVSLDVLEVSTRDGEQMELEFNIERFFGDSAYLEP